MQIQLREWHRKASSAKLLSIGDIDDERREWIEDKVEDMRSTLPWTIQRDLMEIALPIARRAVDLCVASWPSPPPPACVAQLCTQPPPFHGSQVH